MIKESLAPGLLGEFQADLSDILREELAQDIIESEEAVGAIAETNACGFDLDELMVSKISFERGGDVKLEMIWSASGELRENAVATSTEVGGTVEATVKLNGDLELGKVTAEVLHEPEGE